jgi:hypothetical protein
LYYGGFIGNCFQSYVSQCYSTGAVSGNRDAQGFIGQLNFGVVFDCFWDTQTSGQPISMGGGTGKTTAQLKTRSTFIIAGWDFTDETTNGTEDIWRICQDNYPKLVWQLPEGDFVCPDGITIEEDFDFFMDHWGDTNCNQNNKYCDGTDLDFSGTVDIDDYQILLSLWLAENPQ